MSIAHCPNCGELENTPFWKIGTTVHCSNCKTKYAFKDKTVNHRGNSEWALTFDDFEQVLRDYIDISKAQKMFGKSLKVLVRETNGVFIFWSAEGKVISHETIHELIQTDQKLQRDLYGFAMSHWR